MSWPNGSGVFRGAVVYAIWLSVWLLSACGAGGNECASCLQEKCADVLPSCEADPSCACMVECTGNNGIPGVDGCLTTCGLTERPLAFAAVEECVAVACPDSEDECSTPSNWTPPDDLICSAPIAGLGGGALADCSFDSGQAFDADGPILQLESSDKTMCVRLERRNEGAGSLANTEWTLLDIRVGPLGEVAHVSEASQMCWYSSHHNFRDWLHVWTGTRHFDLVLKESGHGGARQYLLYVFEQGALQAGTCPAGAESSACIGEAIELFPYMP